MASASCSRSSKTGSIFFRAEQFAQGILVGDVARPAVGRRDGEVQSRVRVHEPLRTRVVEVRVPARAGVRDSEARANYWRCPKCGAVDDTAFAERDAAEHLRLGGDRPGVVPPRFVYADQLASARGRWDTAPVSVTGPGPVSTR